MPGIRVANSNGDGRSGVDGGGATGRGMEGGCVGGGSGVEQVSKSSRFLLPIAGTDGTKHLPVWPCSECTDPVYF